MSPQHFADGLPPCCDARGVDLLGDAYTQWLQRHGPRLSEWRLTVLLNGRERMREDGEGPYDVRLGLRTPV